MLLIIYYYCNYENNFFIYNICIHSICFLFCLSIFLSCHLAFQSPPQCRLLFVCFHKFSNENHESIEQRDNYGVLVVPASTFPSFLLRFFHSPAEGILECLFFTLTDKLCLVFVDFAIEPVELRLQAHIKVPLSACIPWPAAPQRPV